MTLLEQLRKPEEVKRWFDQIGDQAANEIESLQQQLTAARRSKNECVIDLYRRLDMLDDLNLNLQQKITELKTFIGLDCGDQSCRFAISRTGMRTNGGCRCNPQGLQMERDEFRRKYHEAMDIMTAWKNIDHASAVAQLLKTQQDLAAMERALETCQKQCHLAIEGRRAFRTGFREVRSERDGPEGRANRNCIGSN